MNENHSSSAAKPQRIVVLGSRGVIGHALLEWANKSPGLPVVDVSSADIDLTGEGAARELCDLLRPNDAVVFLSGLTPDKGRDSATLMRNLRMAEAVCQALHEIPPAQLVYMSSDAVYPFSEGPVSETTAAAPTDLYGVMHLAREIMLRSSGIEAPLAILRCTLVLSARDTHNSYGPNRFRKQAREEGKIVLGGGGEETRDHVLVDDVARFVLKVVQGGYAGTLNLASGVSHPFSGVANMVADAMDDRPEIATTERQAPVTHRHFDTTNLVQAFPTFRFTPLPQAIEDLHRSLELIG